MEVVVIAIAAALMAAVSYFLFQRSQKQRAICTAEAKLVLPALRQAKANLPSGEYISRSELEAWKGRNGEVFRQSKKSKLAKCLKEPERSELQSLCKDLEDPDKWVAVHNRNFVAKRIVADKIHFDSVEKYPLTERQRTAIVTAEDTTLVIAGAGTGKTSTIVGKVEYLIRRQLAQPGEILVLAFGKKASEELRERLQKCDPEQQVHVSTFHSFGYEILGNALGKRPSLSALTEADALRRFLQDRIREMLSEDSMNKNLLVEWFTDMLDSPEPEDADLTPDERIRREQARGLHSLSGEKLNSRQEVKIANWLTLNGVRWQYEKPYPVDTATPWRRPYRPDYYLPNYDVYIEHFGIDEFGNTAPHVNRQSYLRAMEWKRALHKEHETVLIETYSYFEKKGGLTKNLAELLKQAGVELQPLSQEQIDEIVAHTNRPFSDFVNLLAQFLSVLKGSALDLQGLGDRSMNERDLVFLNIFGSIYNDYQNRLSGDKEIDFNDMIGVARSQVEGSTYLSRFKYIIVDEFQDISENRLLLLRAIQDQVPHSRLFVVGDDWQSIFRFTGSDVGIITNLESKVGATARVDLNTTFRFRQELVDASSTFVTKNPIQLKKTIAAYGGAASEYPISLILTTTWSDPSGFGDLERCLQDMQRRSEDESFSVFLLGRYNFNKTKEVSEFIDLHDGDGVHLEFHTAHSSKGKEADYVVVLGLEAGEYGFPSNVADDPVMNMVLSDPETYPYAEERRLFYVAITRARRRTYLIAPQDKASPFVIDDFLEPPLIDSVETIGEVSKRVRCPSCGGATIRKSEGQYGAFWACTHYPICHGRLIACPACRLGGLASEDLNGATALRCTECGRTAESCPKCRVGILVERTGKYGPFLACSDWRGGEGCTYTTDRHSSLGTTM